MATNPAPGHCLPPESRLVPRLLTPMIASGMTPRMLSRPHSTARDKQKPSGTTAAADDVVRGPRGRPDGRLVFNAPLSLWEHVALLAELSYPGASAQSLRRVRRSRMFPHAPVGGLCSGAGGSALTRGLRRRHLCRGLCGRLVIAEASGPYNH